MAETKIKIVIDDSGVTKFIDEAGQEINKFADGLKETRLELKRIQDAIASGTFKDDELLKLQKRAGELKDKMGDLAEETRANAGNAFEGLNNNLGLTSDRLMNLDFEGASASLKGLTANAQSLTFGEVKKGLKDFVTGLGNLAKAILANPILLLVGIIAAIFLNWDALVKLWNSSEIASLKKAEESLARQRDLLQQSIEIEQSRGKYSKVLYEDKQKLLRLQVEELKLAQKRLELEGDEEEALKKKEEREKAIADIKKAQVEADGKIFQAVQGAKEYMDPAVAFAQKKKDAAQQELEAIELIKQRNNENNLLLDDANNKEWQFVRVQDTSVKLRDRLQILVEQGILTQEQANQKAIAGGKHQRDREKVEAEIVALGKAKMEQMQWEKQNLANINGSYFDQLKTLQQVADAKMNEVKSEEELKQIEEDKRKQEERNAEAKRKREERLAKIEEARKKLAEDVRVIEKEIAEFKFRGLSAQEMEIREADKKYEIQKATFIQAKKSKEELAVLESQHNIVVAEINKKYADEKYLKDEEIRQKELARVEEQFQLLQQLTSTAKENEVADAIANAEKKYETANNDAQTELAIKLELENKIAEINKKYADEEIKTAKEKSDKLIEIDQKNAEKREAIRDFVIQQIGNGLSIISQMQELGLQNELRIAEAQNKTEEQKDAIRKKYFEKQKQVQIAQALLSTFESAVNMFNAVSKSPITTAFPAAPYIATASAVALGLLNVAKIRNTQFSGGSSNATSPQAPNFSSLSTPQPSMNGSNVQGQQDQPVFQTYVVSGTITDNQELSQLIYNQSKL
ncbi:hypothetical protein UFOVP636_4 [uncultured Caudovirales phage]|uniref:Uncharacterized protein n=1 Tax=uncultured Caudovirales phage TaxID=2100421 RepID=A0A6J5N556_9CAUD|nr:hypothetical protein UFOVP636_4 [uncultured Caudovirales phage]